ncbi:MAG: tRNA 2-thiouridine(34) synthase MnmA [Legionellaceae bacterium]|nr:tRNA 2-thiouridine(34) synthase MnmA [Legionellaceae bacterium]
MAKKVIVGMSGGVDSSVAAAILLEQGFEVEGLFMKNWEQDDKPGFCAAAKDLADAQAVCNQLKIPLHQVNFSKAYWEAVFERVLSEYERGRTPNPDVLCNKEIKFNLFFNHARSLGADAIATGHYARIDANYKLCKAKDRDKDQTYFLHAIDPSVLAHVYFPIGDYLKPQIREIAKRLHLATHAKKDSTGLCFIGERPFKAFLNEFMLATPGEIKTPTGDVLGKHDGLMFYTIGQRQGLNIGGVRDTPDAPWYVVDKDLKNNCLVVAQGSEHPMLYAQGLICGPIHWLEKPSDSDFPKTCFAKTRYRQLEQACMISPEANGGHTILFSNPQRAITTGQYIVFYDRNICLGGAVIEEVIR